MPDDARKWVDKMQHYFDDDEPPYCHLVSLLELNEELEAKANLYEKLHDLDDDLADEMDQLEATNAAQAQTIKAAHIRTEEVSTRYNDCQRQVEELEERLEGSDG